MTQPQYQEEMMNHNLILKPIFGVNLIQELNRHKDKQVQQSHHNKKGAHHHQGQFNPSIQQINDHSSDQLHFEHLNYANKHQSPRFFNLCLNPELQRQQSPTKIRQMDEVNRSVKQIMRCNQEYRGELLSAYQNKTKIQLQNAILIKEHQCLQDQKETLCCELQEQKKKVSILQNSIQRLKENHIRVNQKLKDDAQELHKQLNHLRNTRYDLQNKSNENALLMKKIQSHQIRIKTLEQELEKASAQNLQIVSECSIMKDKYNTCNSQKNNLILVSVDQKKAIQTCETTIKRMKNQIESMNAKSRAITWQYDNLRRQHQYQKHNSQKLLEKLGKAEDNNQQRCRQLEVNQQQYQKLIQAYLNLKLQNEKFCGLPFELEAIRNINQSLIEQINKKQCQVQESNYINSQLTQKLQQAQSQYARLMYELQTFKSNSEANAQNYWHDYQNQKNFIKYGYESQVNMLKGAINQLESEMDRLAKTLSKKQEMIKEKENQICQHLTTILQLEQKMAGLTKDNVSSKIIYQQKFNTLQASLSNHQALIKGYQQAIKQLKGQNLQQQKRQIIIISQKDTLINSLQKNLIQTCEQNQINLQKIEQQQRQRNSLARQRQSSLNAELQASKLNVNQLQNEINIQSQKILAINKELQAKNLIIDQIDNENEKWKALNQDLKGQIAIIQAEYDIIQNELKQQARQKQEIAKKLQRQQRKAQRLLTLNERYASQIQELKLNASFLESKRQTDKKEHERSIFYLNESLSNIRAQHQRYRTTNDSFESINKQIHIIEQMQQALMADPKISIGRFAHHVTALHRQAFMREVQKVNKYQGIVNHCGSEIKAIIQYLKLSVNTINKGFQITFSEKKPPYSTSILCQK